MCGWLFHPRWKTVIHVRPHSLSFFAPFNTCCHKPCFAADSFLHWFLWGPKPKFCFLGGEMGAGIHQTGWEWEESSPCTCPVCKTPCSATLTWCWELTMSSAPDFFWNLENQFFGSFFLPLYEWNKLSCSLQQTNTCISPVACCRLQNWVY